MATRIMAWDRAPAGRVGGLGVTKSAQPSFARTGWRGLAVALGLWTALLGGQSAAQIRYTPADPFVEAMVRKAIGFLEKKPPGGGGELVLAGITVIESFKRYEQRVAGDHPVVQAAVDFILKDIAELRENRKVANNPVPPTVLESGIYKLCLSIILLCEVDQAKYDAEIRYLVDFLVSRQLTAGAFGYTKPGEGDISQSQYAGLAFAVLKIHGIEVNADAASNLLEFYCDAQLQDGDHEGSWVYHYQDRSPVLNLDSIHAPLHVAGASSLYLLSDVLNLGSTGMRGNRKRITGVSRELPPSVVEHIPDRKNVGPNPNAPAVAFDRGKLGGAKTRANRWLKDHFAIETVNKTWTAYFLYGLERYCFFREKSEGGTPEFPDWYDQGVDFLAANQAGDGSWPPRAGGGGENVENYTCLATLFLVRSSQILLDDRNKGNLVLQTGNIFKPGVRLDKQGDQVVVQTETQGMEDVIRNLSAGSSQEDLADMAYALGPAIRELTQKEGKTRGEQMGFLRGLVTEFDPFRRLIAVKFLASQQNLDNVPALLFALTDPEIEIAVEAHNGLRLISRKLDSIPISADPNVVEMRELKKKWTAWFLGLRPDADLLD